ncbi:MAG: hypothetical protein ACJA0U_000806 [Salibacteraceae bacterium]|jgi:hypothetical protein
MDGFTLYFSIYHPQSLQLITTTLIIDGIMFMFFIAGPNVCEVFGLIKIKIVFFEMPEF